MINDTAGSTTYNQINNAQQTAQNPSPASKKILKMKSHDRMGGSIPVWEAPNTPKEKVQERLSLARADHFDPTATANALGPRTHGTLPVNEEFSFADLVDMVNPLHHIPLVGSAYRELTGDQIRSSGKIVGGALFSGPVGMASGIGNAIIENETGTDMTGNVMAMLNPAATNNNPRSSANHPETKLNQAYQMATQNETGDLPASLLAFSNIGKHNNVVIQRQETASGRTAGFSAHRISAQEVSAKQTLLREPITQIQMKPMPAKPSFGNLNG